LEANPTAAPAPTKDREALARGDVGRTVLALSLIIGGIATMAVIIFLAYFHPSGFEHALFYFGMPLTMLTSGTAQVCILVGLWLVWTVVYRRALRRPPGWRPVKWTWTGVPTMWVITEARRGARRGSDGAGSSV
jgi:hypothetical protein